MDNEGLTFAKIGKSLKAAWLRIIIYVVIGVLVVGIALGVYSTLSTTRTFTSKVTFSNDEIHKDMLPWNTSLVITDGVKNSVIVGKALDTLEIDDETKERILPLVVSNLSVTSDFDPNAAQDPNKPTNEFTFTLHLDGYKEIGLSESKTQEILNAVTSVYVAEERNKNAYDKIVVAFDAAKETNNYISTICLLDNQLSRTLNFANEMTLNAPEFRINESKQTFKSLTLELEEAKSILSAAKTMLVANGTMKNPDKVNNEKQYIVNQLVELNSEKEALSAQVNILTTKSKELADSFKGVPANNKVPALSKFLEEYIEMVARLEKTQEQLSEVEANIDFITLAQTGYLPDGTQSAFDKATVEEKAKMQADFNKLVDQVIAKASDLSASLNAGVEQYNAEANLVDAIKVSQAAQMNKTKGVSTVIFMAAEVLVVIIAILIAVMVTNKKGKMQFSKKEKAVDKE